MTCLEMDRWLDDGMPDSGAADAGRHVEVCPRCAAAWRAARELEGFLAAPARSAPEDLTDRVMARIAIAAAAQARVTAPVLPSPLAWWIRAAADPASALAAVLAGLLLWQPRALRDFVATISNAASGMMMDPSMGGPVLAAPFDRPSVLFGLVCAALPIAALASLELFRWSERWVRGGAPGGMRRVVR